MIKQTIHDGWSVRPVSNLAYVPAGIRDANIPARVPGCIHTDLMRAGLIDDPYFGLNEPKLLWIGETDWEYRTSFDADSKLFDHERIDLVCDGLDTVATILLNGTQVARTQNMHRGYRFDVRPMLKKGRNELVITFESPVRYAEQMREKLGHLPAIICGGPFNFIRKMACNFGWDWGPVVPTCGIWRGVRLDGWSYARVVNVTPKYDSDARRIDARVELEFASINNPNRDGKWQIHVWATEEVFRKSTAAGITHCSGDETLVDVSASFDHSPHLWWPSTHGPPNLYELTVELTHTEITPEWVTDWTGRIGLRTVELDTHPDDIGRKFVVKVNNKPIFCKGFNWIPDDCFLDRAAAPGRYRKRIQHALDANANMLRVWGGGIYETDEFYDICDELGILVWQDFLFACAAYPETEPIKSEVEAEARYNVARLSQHPSLVLWNGCNENLWGFHEWSTDDGTGTARPWKEQLAGKQWGQGYYLDLLPRIVKELDPSRPYWAASPWSGDPDVEKGLHPNLATHGNKHIWEVWHGPGDYTNYRWFSPRFCSEFGYQGPANFATMARFFAAEELKRNSATVELHQKSPGGNARNDRLLQKDFDLPENFDDWHYLLQLNQARALTTGVEWFRSRQPVCMGTLYWQLNDCYPVTSWSAIDSEGRLKPLWHATRRFYASRLLTIQPEGDALILYANNDSDEAWRGDVSIRRIDFNGRVLGDMLVPIHAQPRSNLRAAILPVGIISAKDRSRELIVAQLGDAKALWFFAPDRELNYPPPMPKATFNGGRLTVRTETLLRDVTINIDRIDPEATIEDNVVTILPGESFTFIIHSEKSMALEQLTAPPVFQCANRFGKK